MKLPRSVSGPEMVSALTRLGYEVTRQTGSHIRLTLKKHKQHHITIPNHNPIKVGTLAAIVSDLSSQLDCPRNEIIFKLFG